MYPTTGTLKSTLMIRYLSLQEVLVMAMNYQKLWALLKDRNLKKKDLREMAGLSTNVIAKMGKGGDVSTEVLRKICKALNCSLDEIVEMVECKSKCKMVLTGRE